MAVVGDASVVVRAITDKVSSDIQRAFQNSRPVVQAAGRDAGRDYADSFSQAVDQRLRTGLAASISNSSGIADREGASAGRRFSDQFNRNARIGGGGRGGGIFGGLIGEMDAFDRASAAAGQTLHSLIGAGNVAGVAFAGLAGGLSSVAVGLFSVASAAGQAVGALAALPGIAAAAVQGMAAIRLAFTGIGEAVKAGVAPATASLKSQVSSINAVKDAQKGLARAVEQAARARIDADRNVASALRDVRDAEQELLALTKQLNAAREAGAESLQQLGFSAEDAALAEERAALRLEDARAAFLAAQSLPPDSRARKEAELSFKEADLAFREAKDRNADLAKEQAKATKAGVEGTDEVLSVKEKIAEAEEALAKKEERLARSREQRQRQLRDSSLAIADAQERVQRAQESASLSGVAGADKYQQALDKLSPAAQRFVKYLISIKDEAANIKKAASEGLFTELQPALEQIVEKTFPVLQKQLGVTGTIVGKFGKGFSDAVTRGSIFEDLLKSQNETLNIFNREGGNGKTVIDDLTTVVLRLFTAIQPLTQQFAGWLATLIETAEASTDSKKEMEGLTNFFDRAGKRAAQLGDIFDNIRGALVNLGVAAAPSGEGLLNSFEAATQKFEDFTNKIKDDKTTGTFFEDAADNLREISELIAAITEDFTGLADNKGIGKLADELENTSDNVFKILDNFASVGESAGEAATAVTGLIAVFADTGGMKAFFDTITAVVDPVTKFFTFLIENEFTGPIFKTTSAILGTVAALSLMGKVGGGVLRGVGGSFLALRQNIGAALKGIGSIIKKIPLLSGLGDKIAGAGSKLASDDDRPGGRSGSGAGTGGVGDEDLNPSAAAAERFKNNMRELATQFTITGEHKDRFILNLRRLQAQFAAMSGTAAAPAAAATRTATTAATIAPAGGAAVAGASSAAAASTGRAAGNAGKLSKALGGLGKAGKGISGLVGSLVGFGPVVGAVIIGIGLLVGALILLYKKSPEFRKFVGTLVAGLKNLWEKIQPVIQAVGKWLIGVLNDFFKWINDHMPQIQAFFGKVFDFIGKVITDVVVPAFQNFLIPAFMKFLDIVQVVFPIVLDVIVGTFNFLKVAWETVLLPTFNAIWATVKFVIDLVIAYFTFWWNTVSTIFNILKTLWETVLLPVFNAIWATVKFVIDLVIGYFNLWWNAVTIAFNVIKALWENVLLPVFNVIKTVIGAVIGVVLWYFRQWWKVATTVFGVIKSVWENVLSPVFDKIKNKISDVFGKASEIFETFKKKFGLVKDKVDTIKNAIVGAFGAIGTGISNAFSGLGKFAAKGINAFIGGINKFLIGSINKLTGVFGLTIDPIPGVPAKGWASGGYTGPGSKHQVAGLVHADEFVIRKEARQRIERTYPGLLSQMNKTGALNTGGGLLSDIGKGIKSGAGAVVDGAGKLTGAGFDALKSVGKITVQGVDILGDAASYVAKHGVGKALAKIIREMKKVFAKVGIKEHNPHKFTDFVPGFLDYTAKFAEKWGGDTGVNVDLLGAILGGWKKPFDGNYPITQRPNAGHSPPWSVDFGMPLGTAIKAVSRGKLTATDLGDKSYGKFIRIAHPDGSTSLYAHLSQFSATAGNVLAGQTIGLSGSTGRSTGPHLHFELYPGKDTLEELKKRGVKFASGGIAQATSGGILSVIAEAGRNERVEPLDHNGLSKRDQVILETIRETIKNGGTNNDIKDTDVKLINNFFGPTTSGGRMREIDWTLRYATNARTERFGGVPK